MDSFVILLKCKSVKVVKLIVQNRVSGFLKAAQRRHRMLNGDTGVRHFFDGSGPEILEFGQ